MRVSKSIHVNDSRTSTRLNIQCIRSPGANQCSSVEPPSTLPGSFRSCMSGG